MEMMLELYPPILREVVELRLERRLKMMSSITNDKMDRLRDQLREEVLEEQREWNRRRDECKHLQVSSITGVCYRCNKPVKAVQETLGKEVPDGTD